MSIVHQVVGIKGLNEAGNAWIPIKLNAEGGLLSYPMSQLVSANNLDTPAVNTAAVITKAAVAGVGHVLSGIYWSYDDDPTGGRITVENGAGTIVFDIDVTDKGTGFLPFTPPIRGGNNVAMIVTLAAAGAAVTGKLNINTWQE